MPDYFGDALGDVALAVTSPLGFGAGALEAGAGVVAKTLAGPVTGQAIGGGLVGFIDALEDKIQGKESHVVSSTATVSYTHLTLPTKA